MRRKNTSSHKFYVGGGISLYPAARIFEEAAFIAYYFHWNHDDIMALTHKDRRIWCESISKINKSLNDEPKNVFEI